MSIAQDIGGSCFSYGHALSDCTINYIATSSYWTTLESDECNVVFHGICWHGIKSLQHVRWHQEFVTCDMTSIVHNMCRYEKVVGYMKNQLFGSFFEKMFWQQTKLRYDTFCSLIRVVGSSVEQKKYTHETKHPYWN